MFENLTMRKDEIKEDNVVEETINKINKQIKENTDYKKYIIYGIGVLLIISILLITKKSKTK